MLPLTAMRRRVDSLATYCQQPVDAAWLAVFRIGLGVLLAVSLGRFLAYGWVERLLVQPSFHFKYWGFGWVEPLPGALLHALVWLLLVAAIAVALGLWFRFASLLLAVGLSYVQLIDVSTYLNHYYLAALLVWLLSFSPAQRLWSLDAWYRRRATRAAEPSPNSVARGWLLLFRFQIGLVYTFAGLAKAQSDWLLHGQPLGIWLGASTDLPVLGPLFTVEGVPLLMSWCGFLFDTTIVVWLSLERTRRFAFLLLVVFHALTRMLLPIGMFPFIMVLSALVFFEPDWPRRLFARIGRARTKPAVRSVGVARTAPAALSAPRARVLLALGALYCLAQLLLPLRAFAYPGNVLWHEQGMRFSWRVMLRAKGGNVTFKVRRKHDRREWHISPREYLTRMQELEMSGQPDLILQLAHHIERDMGRRGLGPVEVRVDARVALNGRRASRFIDTERDLTAVHDGLGHNDWVLPAPNEPPPHTRPVL